MSLRELDFEIIIPPARSLPPEVTALLAEVELRSDRFYDAGLHKTIPSIIPSKPIVQYAAIQTVVERGLTAGDSFCEWGSGFGTATLLASLLGYESTGVEIEPVLVEFSEKLAEDMGIQANFLEVSYFPQGLDQSSGQGGSELLSDRIDLLNFGEDVEAEDDFYYDGMELALSEIDLFYVYPYPGDQEMFLELFDAVSGQDAVLLTNYEDGAVGCYIKE